MTHTTSWNSELKIPEWAREQFGFQAPLHMAWFIPKGWSGMGSSVVLTIPECELHCCIILGDIPIVSINRPEANRDVEYWVKAAWGRVTENEAVLMLGCDTVEQLTMAVALAEKHLPRNYKRMPLERFYDAKDRKDVPLT